MPKLSKVKVVFSDSTLPDQTVTKYVPPVQSSVFNALAGKISKQQPIFDLLQSEKEDSICRLLRILLIPSWPTQLYAFSCALPNQFTGLLFISRSNHSPISNKPSWLVSYPSLSLSISPPTVQDISMNTATMWSCIESSKHILEQFRFTERFFPLLGALRIRFEL